MPVPGLSLLGSKRIRGFVSILRYINPTIIIIKVNVLDVLRNVKLVYLGYIIYAINGQTKGRNYTNFESNLAIMVIYLPVKFEFYWTKRF